MKDSRFSLCEHEAERVQYWFDKDKESILPDLFNHSQHYDQLLRRKCDLVKIPRLPSQLERLSHYGYERAQSKTEKKKLHKKSVSLATLQKKVATPSDLAAKTTHCCVSQKNAYLIAEQEPTTELSSERMSQTWQLKGHFIAHKKIKTLSKQKKEPSRSHQIVPIHSSKSSQLRKEDQELWEEMLRAKENRLFQIGRITKYLVD